MLVDVLQGYFPKVALPYIQGLEAIPFEIVRIISLPTSIRSYQHLTLESLCALPIRPNVHQINIQLFFMGSGIGDYVMIDDGVYYHIQSYNQGLKEILFETVPIIPFSHNN